MSALSELFWLEVAKQSAAESRTSATDEDVTAFLFVLDVALGGRSTPLPADEARLLGKAAGKLRRLWKPIVPAAVSAQAQAALARLAAETTEAGP